MKATGIVRRIDDLGRVVIHFFGFFCKSLIQPIKK